MHTDGAVGIDTDSASFFGCVAPAPLTRLTRGKLTIFVYENEDDMGLASAISLAAEQCRLIAARGKAGMLLMAAPSV